MFGLTILPINRMFSVLRSVMTTMNGRLNFSTGVYCKDISVMMMPVAAAAVAPASSTSRVAWCTTYRKRVRRKLNWLRKNYCICMVTFYILASETASLFPSAMPLKSALSPNMSLIPIWVNTSFSEYDVLMENFGIYTSYFLESELKGTMIDLNEEGIGSISEMWMICLINVHVTWTSSISAIWRHDLDELHPPALPCCQAATITWSRSCWKGGGGLMCWSPGRNMYQISSPYSSSELEPGKWQMITKSLNCKRNIAWKINSQANICDPDSLWTSDLGVVVHHEIVLFGEIWIEWSCPFSCFTGTSRIKN